METKISQYKGIEVTLTPIVVKEEDIEQQIGQLLESRPVITEGEGPVKEGDTTVIDYCGKKDGVAFDGGTAEGYELTIGSHSFIPGFEEQMVGMAVGETRDLNLKFPEQYHSAELAGAEVVFTVTVHKIINRTPAELTDEFVASLGAPNLKTVEDLKGYTRAFMEQEAAKQETEALEHSILSILIENTEGEVPDELLRIALDNQLNYMERQFQRQGGNLEMYLQMTGMTREQLEEQMKPSVMPAAKLQMALIKIAELEGMEATDEDVENHYKFISETYHVELDEVKKQLPLEAAKKDLLTNKARLLVLNNAVIKREEE